MPDTAFEGLLEYLKQSRSFDFTGYKRSSLERRVTKRIATIGLEGFDAYQDYLEVHPGEFELLFNTILINFTGFFRDPDTWDFLAGSVIPAIIGDGRSEGPIRIWSAGCASGEEAYTIAILLAEALGIEACRERVKIYGTDLDERALTEARQASYDARAMRDVPEGLRAKYFEQNNGLFSFRSDLRRLLVFGRHDLIQDAPISRLDLLVCRNTLIYFNREAQKRIVNNFHFALRDAGFLFLGRAEMLLAQDDLFVPFSVKHRVFRKADAPPVNELAALALPASPNHVAARRRDVPVMTEAAFDMAPVAQIVMDAIGNVAALNARARAMFGLDRRDVGRPFRDLELSYRPLELRSLIDRARTDKRLLERTDVERTGGEAPEFYDVTVVPVFGGDGAWLGVAVSFLDVTERHRLAVELVQAKQEAETASEELQSTNEELETSNEELQSTVEELQTTNEELQSTNEEMETVNEELQSANEEMQAMNEELRDRTGELDLANAFLNSILTSVDLAVIVVDASLKVRLWNHRATDMWGLRPEEVRGRSLLRLDIGLPVDLLREPLEGVMDHNEDREVTLDAINRRGKSIRVRVVATSRDEVDGSRQGAVLLMEEV